MKGSDPMENNESMFREIAENAFDMICLINDQGLFTYCNPSYRFHLGYEPEALFGKSALSLAHPDDLQMAKDLLADLISGKETSHTFLIRLMTADHRTRWVEHRVSRFTRSETNEYQFLIVASDITEKKLLEEKTNINEENFRNFFETITDILMIAERDGTVVYANPATYRKLGYTFAEVKDRGIMGLHPPELRSEAEKIFAAMFRREMDTCPLPLIRKDGSLLPVETRIWFGKWNGTDCLFGLCKDLSLEQEALQRFNKIFDNNPALMAVGALDTRAFIDVNASFLNTLGYTREEIIGKTSRELGLIVEPEKLEEVQQLLNQHGSARNIRMKTRTRDGKILTGLFSAEIIESQGRKLFLTVMVDITSMLETKSALQKSEQELKAFLRAIPDLLFIFDHQGTFQDVYVEDDSRLLVPAEQLKGHYISEFFDAKVSAGALEAFQKSIRENVLVTFPYMISLNGKEEYYEARIVPISNQQVLCMVRDVTDEINALRTIKQSELESRQLQELFRNVADNMPDMLWAKDLDKRFLFVNQAICDNLLHAHSTEEPIGKTDMFFAERERNMHPDDKQWHTFGEICRDSDAIVLESGSTGQFDEFGNVRGEFLYLDVVKSPLKDASGRIIGTVGAARDVTDRKQMEKVNLDQQRQIRLLGKAVEQSPVSIIITNREGVIEYVNPKFSEITGYSAEEAIGKNPRILKSGLMDQSFYKTLWDDLLAGRQWFGEMQNRRKTGEIFWEFSSISPILNESGEITHFVAVKEDVTDHKKLISDFIEAKNKAVESDRLKSAFLMNMSHEIRTPLNGIMGFSSLLASGDFEPAEVSYYAAIINKNSNRLLELINNIVDLSKIDAGTAEVEISTMAPSSRLNDIVHRFSSDLERSYLGVRITIPEEYYFCSFETDVLKFDQIISSLLSNAIKFTRAGEIELGFNVVGDEIIFFVRDTGIGIAPENFLNIFDRFFQVDNSLSRGHEGAGLGLPICKGYTELLDGKIWVESEFGAGATFFVSLPFRMKENLVTPGLEPDMESVASSKKHFKVLVVEDEVSIYQFISIVLKKREYTILHAVDGTEAVTLYKNSKNIDLILMDMKMPIMDGYKATRIIRSMNPDIPIVAITAYAMAGDREKVMQAGCTDYLPKPIRKEALLNMVDKYI